MPEERPADPAARTIAYGPVEDADQTRQAQHQFANDMPVDVNNNAALARSQATTLELIGKASASNQDRRDKLSDHFMANIMKTA